MYEEISQLSDHEVAFVWNRSPDKLRGRVPDSLILHDLVQSASMHPDLIVEVAHPSITAQYGTSFLQAADYMVRNSVAPLLISWCLSFTRLAPLLLWLMTLYWRVSLRRPKDTLVGSMYQQEHYGADMTSRRWLIEAH